MKKIYYSLTVLLASALFFMPESPSFLLSRDDAVGAQRALKWLRGNDQVDIEGELEQMKKVLRISSRKMYGSNDHMNMNLNTEMLLSMRIFSANRRDCVGCNFP